MTNRLDQAFEKLHQDGQVGVIPYLTVGYPSVEETITLVVELVESGAAAIELGIPFSDPLADGPTIQASSFWALSNGVTVKTCLAVCERIRERGITIPLIFMGSYNPIFSYGIDAFAKNISRVGADAVIVPDLPLEESEGLRSALKGSELKLISMLAPTSTLERIKLTCSIAEGFIYCVSVAGVTGARKELSIGLADFLGLVRQHTNLPLALGFGISEKVHIEHVSPYVQAVVIGSKLIEVINSSSADERVANVRDFISKMVGSRVS